MYNIQVLDKEVLNRDVKTPIHQNVQTHAVGH